MATAPSGLCTAQYYNWPLLPRRVRATDCTNFSDLNRWITWAYSMNLTPSPADNDIATASGAWTAWDIPATVAAQDVQDNGDDLLLVGIADRIFLVDWKLFHDVFAWDTQTPIYRKLTFGPLPSTADAPGDSGASYDPFLVKTFRRFTMELNTIPTDVTSRYRISVEEEGRPATRVQGVRVTHKRCDAKIAARGLAFLVTIEHQADEQFDPTWWRAEWDVRGPRIRPNAHTTV